MRPPRALPAAHFDRNERHAYLGERTPDGCYRVARRRADFVMSVGEGGVSAFARFGWLVEVVLTTSASVGCLFRDFLRQSKRKTDDAKSTTESR